MNLQAHIEALRTRVRDCHATRDQIALATNGVVSSSWVSKFASGKMRNPRADSLVALDLALDALESARPIHRAA
ncbi:MAG: hypothetical protein WAT23_16030 [Chromatiaceae bacterium]